MKKKIIKYIQNILFSIAYMIIGSIVFCLFYAYMSMIFDYLEFDRFLVFERLDIQAGIAAAALLLQGYLFEKASYKNKKLHYISCNKEDN
jgi:hypothetical protein